MTGVVLRVHTGHFRLCQDMAGHGGFDGGLDDAARVQLRDIQRVQLEDILMRPRRRRRAAVGSNSPGVPAVLGPGREATTPEDAGALSQQGDIGRYVIDNPVIPDVPDHRYGIRVVHDEHKAQGAGRGVLPGQRG